MKSDYSYMSIVLEKIVNNIPCHIYWQDKKGAIIGCNQRQAEALNCASPDEVIGKTPHDLMSRNEANEHMRCFKQILVTGKGVSIEELATYQQKTLSLMSYKIPLFDQHDHIIGIAGISIDITETKRAEKLAIEKSISESQTKHVETFAGALAHELRTPLAGIKAGADGLSILLPKLIDQFKKSQLQKSIDPKNKIHPHKLALLDGLCQRIQKQASYASLFVDMALMNIRHKTVDTSGFMTQSIKMTINDALDKYPLEEKDKGRILWDPDACEDFTYSGDQMLTIHILFNLLKNALFYIGYKNDAEISIRLSKSSRYNELYFTDTGPGIPADILANIFKPFYTKRPSGSGVGLSFCKLVMEAYGGDILCESTEGKYTTFILQFPHLTKPFKGDA